MQKHSLSVTTVLFLLFIVSANGQANRYSNMSYSNLNDLELPDYSKLLRMREAASKANYERAINECYVEIIRGFRNAFETDEATFDIIRPESSWIHAIEYYKFNEHDGNACILFTKDDKYYVFSINDEVWAKWKSSSSKGQFYDQYIRDNPLYSYRAFCESMIVRKN